MGGGQAAGVWSSEARSRQGRRYFTR
jgi:hypothetical protein